MSVRKFDDQLLQVIYPETVLKEQKNFLRLSKLVYGEASSWCFTSSLCLLFLPFGGQCCPFIQFSH